MKEHSRQAVGQNGMSLVIQVIMQNIKNKDAKHVSRMNRLMVLFTLLSVLISTGAAAHQWRYSGVDRVVAISDVHGAYDAMVRTLASAGVIDEAAGWVAGKTHLVIIGDLLDRGPDSRKVMDLVMRLEREAIAQGGRVHQLLGNHEVMNLVGDLRYVSKAEYAAFAADESADERALWFQHFKASRKNTSDESVLRAEFDDKAPPGFFAHRSAFRADGMYGEWLLNKPLMVVIDGTAFVHGGVSPMVGELGLEGVNGRLGSELTEYVSLISTLNDGGIISPLENFYNHDTVLQATVVDEKLQQSVDSLIVLNSSDMHGPDGPLWYRGSVGCGPLIESDRLLTALQAINANRVVVGHTPTVTRRVLQRLDGRVIEVDTGMLTASYQGSGNALIIEGQSLYAINEASSERLTVPQHPRRVGARPNSLSAEDLERILAHGEVLSQREDERGRVLIEFDADPGRITATFSKKPRSKSFLPELAAYRLDRALQLDMVPVTVEREVFGQAGTVQFLTAGATDEARRRALGRGASAWCPLPDQWQAMYVFDALIYNPGRPPERMLYSADNWQLLLVGHEDTFSSKSGRPQYLKEIPLPIGDAWRSALQSLDDATLTELFDGVLDKKRIGALGKRRDALLK
jgi:hypothetical protein